MRQNKYSSYKLIGFPEKIQALRDGVVTAPIYVRIKPTNDCNHGCFWCCFSTGFRKMDAPGHVNSGMHEGMTSEKDFIPIQKMREILDDFKDMGVRAVTYSGGGEPLMYPDIVETMERTLNHGIDLSIITNGQMLAKRRAEVLARARWVRVSIDYTTAEQMAASRNVPTHNFKTILTNLEAFAKIKEASCDLGVNYIVTRDNYKDLFAFTLILKSCGVENVRFSPMWIPDIREYHAPIREAVTEQLKNIQGLTDERFSVNATYDLDSGAHSNVRTYHHCPTMQIVPVIAADQNVYGCHNVAYTEHGKIGSIRDKSFKELWFSEEAKLAFNHLDPVRDCRHQCAADSKNRWIEEAIAGSQDNFV